VARCDPMADPRSYHPYGLSGSGPYTGGLADDLTAVSAALPSHVQRHAERDENEQRHIVCARSTSASGVSACAVTSTVRLTTRDGCGQLDPGQEIELREDARDVELHGAPGSKRSRGNVRVR